MRGRTKVAVDAPWVERTNPPTIAVVRKIDQYRFLFDFQEQTLKSGKLMGIQIAATQLGIREDGFGRKTVASEH
jgi:hypothetical protein